MQDSNLQPCGYEPPALPIAPMPLVCPTGCSPDACHGPSHYGLQGVCIAKRRTGFAACRLFCPADFHGDGFGPWIKTRFRCRCLRATAYKEVTSHYGRKPWRQMQGSNLLPRGYCRYASAHPSATVRPAGLSPGTRYAGGDRASVVAPGRCVTGCSVGFPYQGCPRERAGGQHCSRTMLRKRPACRFSRGQGFSGGSLVSPALLPLLMAYGMERKERYKKWNAGADNGNRTRITGLEGRGFAFKLYPHFVAGART